MIKFPLNAAKRFRARKLFNFRPLSFSAAFFALGIFFSYAHAVKGASLLWLLALLPAAAFSLLSHENFFRALLRTACLFFAFSLGAFLFAAEIASFQEVDYKAGNCIAAGTVTELSVRKGDCRLELSSLFIEGEEVPGRLIAYGSPSSLQSIRLGDTVVLKGTISTDVRVETDYGVQSDNISSLRRYRLNVTSSAVTGHGKNPCYAVKERMISRIYAGLDGDAADVFVACLTGDSYAVEEGLLENVRAGGVAHLFAVSGLHVGALYLFCKRLGKRLKTERLPKLLRFAFLTLLLCFYGGICGFSASVVRATVLCLTAEAGRFSGIKTDRLENLALAGLLLLAIHPVYLFDVGFRLSFAACFSIILLCRPRREGNRPSAVRRFLNVTFAAQIGTLPVLLTSFRSASLAGLVLNCIFVPLVSGVFALMLTFVFLSCLLPISLAPVLLYLPALFWSSLLTVFYVFDFTVFTVEASMGMAAVPYAGAVICASDKTNLEFRARYVAVGLFLLCFLAVFLAVNVV